MTRSGADPRGRAARSGARSTGPGTHPRDAAAPRSGADRVAIAALALLAVALHARDLTIGFPDQDLLGLDAALVTSLSGLLRGGALPGAFTPLSREIWLWWWGNFVGLGVVGFHVLGAAAAAALTWLVFRLGERWSGPRAGVIAAALLWSFPPLGAMLSSALAARDLLAMVACAGAALLFSRGRTIAAGLAAGAASASSEAAALLPLALVLLDLRLNPGVPARGRLRRLAPAFLAVGAVLGFVFVNAPWRLGPPDVVAVARDFISAWAPGGARQGLAAAMHGAPWLVAAIVVLAFLVVPPRRSGEPRAGVTPAGVTPGLGLALLGLLALAFVAGPRWAEVFAVPALGACLALGTWLARVPSWPARALIAAAALTSLGANGWVPGPEAPGAARDAARVGSRFASHAVFAAQAARTRPVLDALRPSRRELAATPRAFVAGMAPDSTYRLALGPGARVVAHQPALSIRFLAEFTARDAPTSFGVLRYDATRNRFVYDRATALVRARVGEGLLLFSRFEEAAACFAAAAADRPDDEELSYPWVISLAAAGHVDEARARWQARVVRKMFPSADTLAAHLMAGPAGLRGDSAGVTVRLAAAVVADPVAAGPHLALGRRLLELGRPRSAAIELAAGAGMSRRSQDLFWVARAYDALGASGEALEAYRAALAGGLDSLEYGIARRRFAELLSGPAGATLIGSPR